MKKGFTLIELLVVISIIALLSSIVIASLMGARERAKKSAFLQSMRQIGLALELYRSENGVYPYEDDLSERSFSIVYYTDAGEQTFLDDDLTEALTNIPGHESFLSDKYINNFPVPIGTGMNGFDDINYSNKNAVGVGSKTCHGKPAQGYLIGFAFPGGTDPNQSYWECITGSQ